ncbi:MAG: diguanylate cyclase, partial [Gammaproteobacteria bacterium]
FETVEAIDGENAWELLNNAGPFSLVVSDLTMPTLDGYGLLKRIRSSHLPEIKAIPVIIITGSNDSESTKERATQAGATDFIGKPFDSVHLLARTQAHASAHTTSQILAAENIGFETQALTDPLTGLANEAAFMDHSYQQLSYAVRHKTSLAVFRVEIDDFGDLFKQHGKDLSESIIKSVAMVLQAGIRYEDMAARVGTARFSLLLPGMNTTGIHNLADRINRDISARILKQGEHKVRYTVSIGVAAPEIRRDTRFDELLSIADSRLVYAMAQGGNQVAFEESGPAVPTPHEEAAAEVNVPLLLDEDITAMINQSVEAEIVYESITIENDASLRSDDVIAPDETAVVESRAAQEPDDLPSMFAGPVPELSVTAATAATQAETHRLAAAGPAAFRFGHAADDDETIIITAPFDSYDSPDEIPAAGEQAGKTPPADATPDHESATENHRTTSTNRYARALLVPGNDTRAEETFESIILPRPGIFRRMLSSIASLFRRSRQTD